jgi:hypothetical protein
MSVYVRLRLALMPCGGSFVNFSDICNRPMGKLLCTSVVIQSLKKKV